MEFQRRMGVRLEGILALEGHRCGTAGTQRFNMGCEHGEGNLEVVAVAD